MTNIEHHIKTASALTMILENRFKLGSFRFGLDPILGLAPGVGDTISLVLSLYIVWIGVRIGLSVEKIAEMLWNVTVDFIIGLVPFIGDVSDFVYRANSKNLAIIKSHKSSVIEGEVVK